MQRLLSALLAFCLFACCACAEISCQCGKEDCECFIQLGDDGPAVAFIQAALVAQGFLAENADGARFDDHTLQAVLRFQQENHLPTSGMMDDETLTLLIWGMLPDALDAYDPESSTVIVWVPTDGGLRHHARPDCCQMKDPRMVSQRNALAMDMLRCGRCKPFGYLKPAKD